MSRVQVLILEDVPSDAELMQVELSKAGIVADVRVVSSEAGFLKVLTKSPPDIILSDYNVPGFSGMAALALRNSHAPQIPFIFVTGSLGEERAVATLRSGATDYVLKDRMARLATEVNRALLACEQKRQHEQVAAELESERQLVHAILDTVKALIVVIDRDGHILHLNPAAIETIGSPSTDVLGQVFWNIFAHTDSKDFTYQYLVQAMTGDELPEQIRRSYTPNGRIILWSIARLPSTTGQSERLVLSGVDVTEREQAAEKIYFLHNFDPATKLPNRQLFLQQLAQYCATSHHRHGELIVAMMVGLGRIQEIRDSYGEDLTNLVLEETVERLRSWEVKCELLARVADHTFALAFEVHDDDELIDVVPHILQSLHAPIEIEDKHWVLPVHGGVAIFHRDAQDAMSLLQAAEAALHLSENQSDKGYALYSSDLSEDARERLLLESELHDALKAGDQQLILYYQPQLNLTTSELIGFEALIRWRHPRLGLVYPDRFISIAENSDLMPELGKWVLHTACKQLKSWQAQGLTLFPVAINISASQFASPYLLNDIETALMEFDIAPALLELELTESASMIDPQATIMIMTQLRHMGVGLAIDDFGTGYSNLSYLKRFPVRRLKLDQAFVRDITTDTDDLAISHAVIAIAHQLNLQVVAEGIETPEQLAILKIAKCDFGQGYWFSVPVTGDACVELIQKKFILP